MFLSFSSIKWIRTFFFVTMGYIVISAWTFAKSPINTEGKLSFQPVHKNISTTYMASNM